MLNRSDALLTCKGKSKGEIEQGGIVRARDEARGVSQDRETRHQASMKHGWVAIDNNLHAWRCKSIHVKFKQTHMCPTEPFARTNQPPYGSYTLLRTKTM